MKFLYGIKGCSHCDINRLCKRKNDPELLVDTPIIIKEGSQTWWSKCREFFRMAKNE